MAGGDFNLEGGSKDYSEATKLFGRESVSAPDFKPTYSTRSFLTPPGWRDVIWEANLDHVFTNLEVLEYDVVNSDMSDHFPLHIIAAQPSQPDTTLEIIEEEQPRVKHTGGAMQIAWTRQVSPCANKLHSRIHIMPKHSIQVHAPKVVVPLMFEDIPMSP